MDYVEFSKCPKYKLCQEASDKMRTMMAEHEAKGDALKALQEKIDSMYQYISSLALESKNQSTVLEQHMQWEEKWQQWAVNFVKVVAALMIPLVISFVIWNYNNHTDKMVEIAKQSERLSQNNILLENMYTLIKETKMANDQLAEKVIKLDATVGSNTNLMNRNYGQIEGLKNTIGKGK